MASAGSPSIQVVQWIKEWASYHEHYELALVSGKLLEGEGQHPRHSKENTETLLLRLFLKRIVRSREELVKRDGDYVLETFRQLHNGIELTSQQEEDVYHLLTELKRQVVLCKLAAGGFDRKDLNKFIDRQLPKVTLSRRRRKRKREIDQNAARDDVLKRMRQSTDVVERYASKLFESFQGELFHHLDNTLKKNLVPFLDKLRPGREYGEDQGGEAPMEEMRAEVVAPESSRSESRLASDVDDDVQEGSAQIEQIDEPESHTDSARVQMESESESESGSESDTKAEPEDEPDDEPDDEPENDQEYQGPTFANTKVKLNSLVAVPAAEGSSVPFWIGKVVRKDLKNDETVVNWFESADEDNPFSKHTLWKPNGKPQDSVLSNTTHIIVHGFKLLRGFIQTNTSKQIKANIYYKKFMGVTGASSGASRSRSY